MASAVLFWYSSSHTSDVDVSIQVSQESAEMKQYVLDSPFRRIKRGGDHWIS
jgi:hypothetical protein